MFLSNFVSIVKAGRLLLQQVGNAIFMSLPCKYKQARGMSRVLVFMNIIISKTEMCWVVLCLYPKNQVHPCFVTV